MTRRPIHDLHDLAGEAVVLAGGGRALLLQLAHPAVGHGVADHSDFASRPLDRLHGTMTYLYAIVFGSPDEVAFVRRMVNRAHGPVRSSPDARVAYTAFDPHLQLWVAATLYDSAVTIVEYVFGTLPGETLDRVYREYERVGTALQMPADLWPADRQAFARYWSDQLATLRVDATTRSVAHRLLHPTNVPVAIRLAMPLARLITTGLLPERLRDEFGLPWGRRRERRFEGVMRLARRVVPSLPDRLRHVARDHYGRRLARAIAAATH
ncbi:oxygenase MpaB family protein [Frigoribacterium sp. 2-23]|uniref:oxygenase MpaB family protein n=1 Tax=Frigoribacterium sp. 2-23 TaxID=3415006 RepID=UPI003C6F45BA